MPSQFAVAASGVPTRHSGRYVVLVVDDEPQVLAAIQDTLEDEFNVLTETSAPAAMTVLENEPEVSVILSDERMPGMAGSELLAWAKGFSDATRVMITGYADLDAVTRAVNLGKIFGYISKPWDPGILKQVVHGAAEYCRLQRDLSEEQRLLRSLMDNIPDAIFFKDLQHRFIRMNRAYADYLGIRQPKDAMGKTLAELLPGELAKSIEADEKQIIATGHPVIDRTERLSGNGLDRLFSRTVAPVFDETGRVESLVSVVRDITEREHAYAELAARMVELERSNADLEQFAYVASHDLQEPLRSVASYAQLLARRYGSIGAKDADQFVAYITDAVHHMQELIDGLLTYSRITRGGVEFARTDLSEVLDIAISNLRTAIEASGATVTHDPLPTLSVDRQQIAQLFQNLLANACKFRGKDAPKVHVSAKHKGEGWVFSVQDNGIGIDPQYFNRIFVLFQRLHTRDRYPGSGIGLSICKKVVERHGGRIWVESANPGSVFRFTLPAGEQGASTGGAKAPKRSSRSP